MKNFIAWFAALMMLAGTSAPGADWPQWRYDSYRSAASPEELPAHLRLQWTRVYSQRVQLWDDPLNHDLMTFDKVFEPVVLGDRMFVGFNDRDKLVALDIHSGREVWTFFTDGPVRLPPAAWEGRVYFVSDDGNLYCVRASDGSLLWKHRGAPADRKVLGNGRVISAWPARGGPVVRDGQVYFAASIWPFMGTFVHALDARTGHVMWVNDGTGSQFIKQPHSAPAFAGVAPQGALVATRDKLLVPGGRSVPAAFDRSTGQFLYFQLDDAGKGNGGSFVAATDAEFFVHTRVRGTRLYDLKNGKKGTFTINEPVLTAEAFYSGQTSSFLQAEVLDAEQKLAAARKTETDNLADIAKAEDEANSANYKKATNTLASTVRKVRRAERTLASAQEKLSTNWAGHVIQAVGRDKKLKWEINADGTGDIIQAGRRLYAAGSNSIIAVDLPGDTAEPRIAWSNHVDGRVFRLLAANGKLFAVTLDGRIMAFGPEPKRPAQLVEPRAPRRPARASVAKAKTIIEQCDARQGYALWFGVDDAQLLEAVLAGSELQIVAVDPDATKIEQLRRRFDAAGLYGTRVALHVGEPLTFKAPPYVANLVVVGDSVAPRLANKQVLKAIYESVRPYGGALWVSHAKINRGTLMQQVLSSGLVQAKTDVIADGTVIVREGALPGSADWTHQYGNVGNTVKSDDALVKLPLGLLWFGGNTHMDVLPRHGHGPSQQIAGGRLFIEGMTSISARDVYTGRVMWKKEFEDLGNFGVYYDASYTNTPLSTAYNQKHIPGANARGANYVVTADSVYVVVGSTCHVLDTRDGRTRRIIPLPRRDGEEQPAEWGYIGLYGDVLLAGAGFAHYTTRLGLATTPQRTPGIVDLSASRGLVALDRHTGQMLWRIDARHSFVHNGIVAGKDRVYCLDKLPKSTEDRLKRRGRPAPTDYRIAAYDVRTGKLVWEATTNIFGTWLGFSESRDVLLQAGASSPDRLKDEASQGMITYRGSDGDVLWRKLDLKYTGPCILHNDMIITTPASYKASVGAYDLLDGTPRTVVNPLTGLAEPLRIYRTYGCNYPVACEHLVTFRSGAAGFYDLETHSGTGNFGGFKSGCSANLIAADGVLSAPDYTRTCSCSYQNQTSLALIHMPDVELWTHNQYGSDARDGERIRRVGINFGAPGDRLSETGTLWLDYPSVGGNSPNLSVSITSGYTNYFRRHASQVLGDGPAWVMASGIYDAETISIRPETRRTGRPPAKKKADEDDDDDDDDEEEDDKNGKEKSKTDAANGETAAGDAATNKVERAYVSKLAPAYYTVRLYFAEPEQLAPGDRVFGVQLQGEPVLHNFDIAAVAAGSRRGIVKEFRNVLVPETLTIGLVRAPGTTLGPLLCGVEMVLQEDLARDTSAAGQ